MLWMVRELGFNLVSTKYVLNLDNVNQVNKLTH